MRKVKVHRIKLASDIFDDVEKRRMNFVINPYDRNYRVGDWLIICKWDGTEYTGDDCVRRIKYVQPLLSIGLDGWIAMGID